MVKPLVLKRFNVKSIKDNGTMACIGKRRSGKSVLIKDIMWHKRHLPVGVAMSPTEKANRFFRDFMPEVCIYDDFNLEAIESILTRQQRIKEAEEKGDTKGLPKNTSAFIVADDCMYDKKNWKSLAIRNCFMNGRHWSLFFLFSMQYCVDISPDLRTNLDYVFVFRESVTEQKEKLYKYFFGMFENKKEFIKVFDQTATGFDFMCLDLTLGNYEKEECVFWGRADDRKQPFRVGHPRLWWFAGEFARHGVAKGGPPRLQAAPEQQQGVAGKRKNPELEHHAKANAGGRSDAAKKRGVEMGLGRDNSMQGKTVIKLGEDGNGDDEHVARAAPPVAPQVIPAATAATKRPAPDAPRSNAGQPPQGMYRPPSPFGGSRSKRTRR